MRHISRTSLACLLAFLLCRPSAAQTTQPLGPDESKFLRFVPAGADSGKLEASVVTYRNADGVTVDLIAAVHVADKAFFRDLDDSFAQYDSLLYEMVKPKDMEFGPRTPRGAATRVSTTRPAATRAAAVAPRRPPSSPPRAMSWVGNLQRFLKDNLELSFQLEEINYNRPNFVHADLDVETFQQMQEDRGESMLTLMLQTMLKEMADDSPKAAAQPGIMDLIAAMQSPDHARQLKLILAKSFTQMDDMLSGNDGPNGNVIVGERNKAAIKVLRERILAGDKKIGIFYGAAHLKGMEQILLGDLGFEQVGAPKWRTAWDLSPK